MNTLFKMILPGLVLFIGAAIIQEREYFSDAWFGRADPVEQAEESEEQAVAALRQGLALMSHLYSSGGDPRFADRIAAGPDLLDEIQTDIAYLARNGRIQEPRLQKLELLSVEPGGFGRMELHTREFWIHRMFWADGRGESDPPRSEILFPTYRMVRDNRGWRIQGWEFRPPGSE